MIIADSGRAYPSIDCGKEGTAELADGSDLLMLLLGIIGGRMKVFQTWVRYQPGGGVAVKNKIVAENNSQMVFKAAKHDRCTNSAGQ
ncbi:hypothetical protein T4E_5644 [Trichinella pseudospiralis]|uniref:Uncharacterized protein n=1 Tax=Trichinella pseudospiralis TaxID=6337 RepID=A0A0V0YGG1_TRIPS|nr:hypothetical protein T4E_5644 [Trichinella pseudospiralis]